MKTVSLAQSVRIAKFTSISLGRMDAVIGTWCRPARVECTSLPHLFTAKPVTRLAASRWTS